MQAALGRRPSRRRRRRAPVLPRAHGQRRRADRRGAVARPERMLHVYHQSAATLNLLRGFAKGGFADLKQVHAWNQEFVAESPEGQRYERIAAEIERALRFMAACGIDLDADAAAARGRPLDEPRGPAARLRGGADAARLADRRLVRLLRPHALDRRAHAPARRRARRVLLRRPQPDRRQARAGRRRRRTWSSSASGSTLGESLGG